jgi:hypothetical protein
MNAVDVVGYVSDGAIYCPHCTSAEMQSSDPGMIFADNESWEDDACGACGHSLACCAGLSHPVCRACFPPRVATSRRARKMLPELPRLATEAAMEAGAAWSVFVQDGSACRARLAFSTAPAADVASQVRRAGFREIGTGQWEWVRSHA